MTESRGPIYPDRMSSSITKLPEVAPDSSQRRSLLQTLNGAGRQFWGRLIVAALFVLPLVAAYAGHLLYSVMQHVTELKVEDAAAAQMVVHELRSVGFLFLSVIILLCLLSIFFVFFLSVRVYGPQVALLRFIDQLKAGNYQPYRKLRKDDQLKELWQGLQELAETLARRR